MERILEPEVMDSWEEATEYDAMDFTEVNTAFAAQATTLGPAAGLILDAGTGTARIPLLIAQQCPDWQIIGIDLAENMLQVGLEHVMQAGLESQIDLQIVDAKHLPYPEQHFDMIISNSLVHHLPNPLPFFQEVKRSLKPNGALLLRDLLRPADETTLNQIVATVGLDYDPYQALLFRNSLQAALTLTEVQQLVEATHLEKVKVYQSSDRHWTVERSYKLLQ